MRQFLMALAAACTMEVGAAVDIAIVHSGADLEVRVPAGLAEDGDGLTLVWDDHDHGVSGTSWAHRREIVPSLSASGGVFTTPVAELGTGFVYNSADADWYYFRVAGSDGEWLGNLVPARVGAAGTPCLYDSVEGRVVPVKGTGSATVSGAATNTVSALAYASGVQLLVHGEVTVLDVKCPRVGHPLTVEGFDSATNDSDLVCAWYRGTPKKVYDSVPFATGLEFTPAKADAEHWIRCVVSVSTKFCRDEYDNLMAWLKGKVPDEVYASMSTWEDVKDWPGRIVGTIGLLEVVG